MTKALDLIDMLDSEYARVVNIYSFTTSEGKSLHNDKALAAPFYLNERSIVDD